MKSTYTDYFLISCTTLRQDESHRNAFHHHLNPKGSSPRRTSREEDVPFPDVTIHATYGGTCGYSPAFLSSATCSNTMC